MQLFDLTAERERLALAADCSSCFGLCCVAHGFRASASFALDKPAGQPCPNLLVDFGCAIHRTLRPAGFPGCIAYTCYGAGQQVAQEMFEGKDWRRAPETAELMFQTFPIVRQLKQLLWFITEALDRSPPGSNYQELLRLLDETERLTAGRPDEMSWGDIDHHCLGGEILLSRVSAVVRTAAVPVERPAAAAAPKELPNRLNVQAGGPNADLRCLDLRGRDLRSADLHNADLRGADLWGAVLSNADLSGADLRWADFMGADLSRANLAGADFSAAIFLTQGQLELADGDAGTTVSAPLEAPAHWVC